MVASRRSTIDRSMLTGLSSWSEKSFINIFQGFRALKMVKAKICYVSAIDASEQRPAQMEESMNLVSIRSH